jgi:acyl-[acyl-carrier-protein] desaturase
MAKFSIPAELDSVAGSFLERHLAWSREWFPHELVPWSQGRDFVPGECTVADPVLPAGVSSALFVNLLTEDNLPHYYHAVAAAFGTESAMGEWSRRWAAEEQRHAIVIRDWICVARRLDLVALERARMHQVSRGFQAGGRSYTLSDSLVYLALQELATRLSHRNTAQHLDDVGAAVMKRVAADENLHFLFYRDLATALLGMDASEMVLAIDRQVTQFEMPGTGILGFAAHAAAIAAAGIYDYRVHYEQILLPVVLTHWGMESIEGLNAEAEVAREHVLAWIARMKRVADRIEAQTAATLPMPSP